MFSRAKQSITGFLGLLSEAFRKKQDPLGSSPEATSPGVTRYAQGYPTDDNERTPLLSRLRLRMPSGISGYFLITLAAICGAAGFLLIRIGAAEFNYPLLSSMIVTAGISTLLAALALLRVRPSIPGLRSLLLLAGGGLLETGSIFCMFAALKRVPVGTAVTIYASSPAIKSFFGAIFLRQGITGLELVALLTTFAGVVLVTRPTHLDPRVFDAPVVGALLALIAAFAASGAYTLVRSLGLRVHSLYNVAAFSLGTCALCTSFARGSDFTAAFSNGRGLLVNGIAAVLAFLSGTLANAGLRRCPPGGGRIIRNAAIVPFAFLFGFLFLGENGSWMVTMGVLLVLLSTLVVGVQASARGDRARSKGAGRSAARLRGRRASTSG